jgi:hypothetical protein
VVEKGNWLLQDERGQRMQGGGRVLGVEFVGRVFYLVDGFGFVKVLGEGVVGLVGEGDGLGGHLLRAVEVEEVEGLLVCLFWRGGVVGGLLVAMQ